MAIFFNEHKDHDKKITALHMCVYSSKQAKCKMKLIFTKKLQCDCYKHHVKRPMENIFLSSTK